MAAPAEHDAASGLLADEDVRALTRLLRRSLGRGFRLVVIEVGTPRQRKRIIEWLRGELDPLRGELIELDVRSLPGENFWSELDQRLDHGTVHHKRVVLAMYGFQEAVGGQPDENAGPYRQLNVQRELFVRDVGCFWVLLIDPYGSRKLQDIAPDFCDFASLWFRAPEDALAAILARLALVHRARGDLEAARRTIEHALATQASVFGTELAPSVATSLRELGVILREQGDLERDRQTFERSLAIDEPLGTQAHLKISATLDQLARVHRQQGDLDGARQLFERAVDLSLQVFGTELHPHVADQLYALALTLAERGELDEAVATFERTLNIQARIHGPDHVSTCTTEAVLAHLLLDRGDRARAEALLQHARPILADAYGPTHELVQHADQLLKARSHTPSA